MTFKLSLSALQNGQCIRGRVRLPFRARKRKRPSFCAKGDLACPQSSISRRLIRLVEVKPDPAFRLVFRAGVGDAGPLTVVEPREVEADVVGPVGQLRAL